MPRRQTYEICCPQCDGSDIWITHTRTQRFHPGSGERILIRRQHCECQSCGHSWWRRLRISETEVRRQQNASERSKKGKP